MQWPHTVLPRPLWDLQYTVGTLRFACTVVCPGRAFLRRLIDLTIGIKKQYHFIRVRPVRDDLYLWAAFLTEFNSESLLLPERWQQAQIIHLFTDVSSSLGYGAVLGKQWFSGVWDNEWQGQNIKLLEQYPSPWLSRSGAWPWHTNVLIFTGTQALVSIIKKLTTKDCQIMFLVRVLVLVAKCLLHNILFQAQHVAGMANTLPNLSPLQVSLFRDRAPHTHLQPTPVPPLLNFPSWWGPWQRLLTRELGVCFILLLRSVVLLSKRIKLEW